MGDIPHVSISNSAEGIGRRSLLDGQTYPESSLGYKALEVRLTAKGVRPGRIDGTSLCTTSIKHQAAKRLLHWFTLEAGLECL